MIPNEPITPRQLEVARLIAEGRSNPEIAETLGIALAGAEYHVSELIGRLGARSRAEVAEWYRREGRHAHGSPDRGWRRHLRAIGIAGAVGLSAAAAAVMALAIGGGQAHDGGVPATERGAASTEVTRAAPSDVDRGLPTTDGAMEEEMPLFYEYKWQSGDTPQAVAARFGVSVNALLESNLDFGAARNEFVLLAAEGLSVRVPSVEGVLYTVREGDTLESIAAVHHVAPEAIRDFPANRLGLASAEPQPGQTILIPSGWRLLPPPSPTSSPSGDAWSWPVEGEMKTAFSPAHPTGIDIRSELGTPVTAAADGEVSFVGGESCCDNGYHVVIEHQGGYSSLYAHLADFQIDNGSFVNAGDVIGHVGMTGLTDEPHLHFEIRRDGEVYLDPLSLLPPRPEP